MWRDRKKGKKRGTKFPSTKGRESFKFRIWDKKKKKDDGEGGEKGGKESVVRTRRKKGGKMEEKRGVIMRGRKKKKKKETTKGGGRKGERGGKPNYGFGPGVDKKRKKVMTTMKEKEKKGRGEGIMFFFPVTWGKGGKRGKKGYAISQKKKKEVTGLVNTCFGGG